MTVLIPISEMEEHGQKEEKQPQNSCTRTSTWQSPNLPVQILSMKLGSTEPLLPVQNSQFKFSVWNGAAQSHCSHNPDAESGNKWNNYVALSLGL